jgi:hypothetical protein
MDKICTKYILELELLKRTLFYEGENGVLALMHGWGCPIDKDGDEYTYRDGWDRACAVSGQGVVFDWTEHAHT